MNAPRPPIVAGVAGGAGTSLIASLIGAVDGGRAEPGDAMDVLVCRSVSRHLSLATRIAAAAPVAPVVVISADAPGRPPHQVRDRARILQPNVPALLWLPWIDQLRSMSDPPAGLREACLEAAPAPWVGGARELRDALIAAVSTALAAEASGGGPIPDEAGDPASLEPGVPQLRHTS